MKIILAEVAPITPPAFKPGAVTITFESQRELDLFTEILTNYSPIRNFLEEQKFPINDLRFTLRSLGGRTSITSREVHVAVEAFYKRRFNI